MPQVRVDVELSEKHYRRFQDEAKRRGLPVESLVQQMTQVLVREEEQRQTDDDHPIFTS